MTTKYEQPQPLCEAMAWTILIEWTGRTGVHHLDDGRVAKLTLAERGYSSHYPGFEVKIISKTDGLIDQEFIRFDPAIPTPPAPLNGRSTHVWENNGWRWYFGADEPDPDTTAYCKIVEDWIDNWRMA